MSPPTLTPHHPRCDPRDTPHPATDAQGTPLGMGGVGGVRGCRGGSRGPSGGCRSCRLPLRSWHPKPGGFPPPTPPSPGVANWHLEVAPGTQGGTWAPPNGPWHPEMRPGTQRGTLARRGRPWHPAMDPGTLGWPLASKEGLWHPGVAPDWGGGPGVGPGTLARVPAGWDRSWHPGGSWLPPADPGTLGWLLDWGGGTGGEQEGAGNCPPATPAPERVNLVPALIAAGAAGRCHPRTANGRRGGDIRGHPPAPRGQPSAPWGHLSTLGTPPRPTLDTHTPPPTIALGSLEAPAVPGGGDAEPPPSKAPPGPPNPLCVCVCPRHVPGGAGCGPRPRQPLLPTVNPGAWWGTHTLGTSLSPPHPTPPAVSLPPAAPLAPVTSPPPGGSGWKIPLHPPSPHPGYSQGWISGGGVLGPPKLGSFIPSSTGGHPGVSSPSSGDLAQQIPRWGGRGGRRQRQLKTTQRPRGSTLLRDTGESRGAQAWGSSHSQEGAGAPQGSGVWGRLGRIWPVGLRTGLTRAVINDPVNDRPAGAGGA